MTKQEELKAIFIEEASEIVEKLDVDIIRFEENSNDLELLNEIFRGVHTLKGNSNAFGFTRLGEFVHHFEDLLDYYRSTKESIEENNLELFVESVDVVREVMRCELDSIEELPKSYFECLEKIKILLDIKKNRPKPVIEQKSNNPLNDLALEFALDTLDEQRDEV
ncbi:MAG: Hpt domain-containing protein, partial [Campylobacterota bacterium]